MTETVEPSVTDAVREAIESNPTEDGILMEWVLVGAWMQPNGQVVITRLYDDDTPAYRWRGLLHEALNDDGWDDEETP